MSRLIDTCDAIGICPTRVRMHQKKTDVSVGRVGKSKGATTPIGPLASESAKAVPL